MILTDAGQFPTDGYLADSVARLLGLEVARVSDPSAALRDRGGEVAVRVWSAVDFRTGERRDVAGLTAAAHDAGALAVWDLRHAAGAVPLRLDEDRADMAVGCTYKYPSGGPGAPAFTYVARRHQAGFDQPLTGWHGHARPFAMDPGYAPAAGISRARIGTPPMLSLLALEAALDVFGTVEMAAVRAKSLSLGGFFIACADELLAGLGFGVVTPREPERRGSHVTLRHPDAHPVMAALIEAGVIGDVRPPDLLRFGFNALYTSYEEVYSAVAALREVTASARYREPGSRCARPSRDEPRPGRSPGGFARLSVRPPGRVARPGWRRIGMRPPASGRGRRPGPAAAGRPGPGTGPVRPRPARRR